MDELSTSEGQLVQSHPTLIIQKKSPSCSMRLRMRMNHW